MTSEMLHSCAKKEGLIIDVTTSNDGDIKCRGCGTKLTIEQVHPDTLSLIQKEKNAKKYNKSNKFGKRKR